MKKQSKRSVWIKNARGSGMIALPIFALLLIPIFLFAQNDAGQTDGSDDQSGSANKKPNIPRLIYPSDAEANIPTNVSLQVEVTDPEKDNLEVTFFGRQAGVVNDNFTVVVLPDTQSYMLNDLDIFSKQTEWIVKEKESRDIVFVSHLGDIVEHWNNETEWKKADNAMRTLDNVIPYGILPGNHDMTFERDTRFYNKYFPVARFSKSSWYGGSFPEGTNNNNFQIISAGGLDILFLNLEFCPTPNTITWANTVVRAHPDKRVIISTHGYLNVEGVRRVHDAIPLEWTCSHEVENSKYIWESLAFENPNVFMILSGHAHSENRRLDYNISGKPVHQILANYQTRENGGNGFLRVMTFKPFLGEIHVETYSPYLDEYERDSNSQFVLTNEMNDQYWLGIQEGVESGSDVTFEWVDLQVEATYEWYARVSNTLFSRERGPIWTFQTSGTVSDAVIDSIDQVLADDQNISRAKSRSSSLFNWIVALSAFAICVLAVIGTFIILKIRSRDRFEE